MPVPPKIIELRQILAERYPRQTGIDSRCLPTGWSPLQALKATDLLLRDGNLSLVILDFKENPDQELRKIPGSAWYRFQRIIEESRNALLAITRHPIVKSAQVTILTTHRLRLDDLSTERTDLIKFISLEIIRLRASREYRYA
jgi:hypothetical protein